MKIGIFLHTKHTPHTLGTQKAKSGASPVKLLFARALKTVRNAFSRKTPPPPDRWAIRYRNRPDKAAIARKLERAVRMEAGLRARPSMTRRDGISIPRDAPAANGHVS
jgi:hypothetical protein